MRIRKCQNQSEYESVIDDYITQGYKVQDRGQVSTKLKNSSWGSGWVHFFLALFFWWLVFIPNVIYAFYKNSKADEVLVRNEAAKKAPSPQGTAPKVEGQGTA